MKTWQIVAMSVLLTLLGAGLIVLVTGQPRGEPVQLISPPTAVPVVVQIDGSVQNPGLYTLPEGSRLSDAVFAAGGFTAEADSQAVNQAAHLNDGSYVWIPALGDTPESMPTSAVRAAPLSGSQSGDKIDLNAASAEQLQMLPGIGPTRAEAIIQYRTDHGDFKAIEDLVNVPGIGPSTFDNLKDLIFIN